VLRQTRRPSFPVRYRRGPFVGLGAVMLSAALAGSRIISFCLTASHALPRARHPVFSRLTPGYLGGKTEVCLRPLICYGQTRASRPPPLQHRVPTRAARKLDFSKFGQRQPYPDRSGAFSVTGRPAIGNRHLAWTYDGSVSASRHPGHTYEPLDVIILSSTSRDSDSKVWSQPLRHPG